MVQYKAREGFCTALLVVGRAKNPPRTPLLYLSSLLDKYNGDNGPKVLVNAVLHHLVLSQQKKTLKSSLGSGKK